MLTHRLLTAILTNQIDITNIGESNRCRVSPIPLIARRGRPTIADIRQVVLSNRVIAKQCLPRARQTRGFVIPLLNLTRYLLFICLVPIYTIEIQAVFPELFALYKKGDLNSNLNSPSFTIFSYSVSCQL